MVVFLLCCMLCSGCITYDSNEETAPPTSTVAPTTSPPTITAVPTTATPSAYTFPKYESQLQEEIAEWDTACDVASAEWQNALETLRALAESPDSAQDGLYQAFTDYNAAIQEYERVLQKYYGALILSEHTEPTENGMLVLMNETVPFDRPDGNTYSYGLLNMEAQSYMARSSAVELRIRYGVGGQRLLDAIDTMEECLLDYHDAIIGYVYNEMNQYLTCLSQCTDGSVVMCGCSISHVL